MEEKRGKGIRYTSVADPTGPVMKQLRIDSVRQRRNVLG